MWRQDAGNYVDKHCTITILLLSVIVYVLRQNCRAAGWRWDTRDVMAHLIEILLDRIVFINTKSPSGRNSTVFIKFLSLNVTEIFFIKEYTSMIIAYNFFEFCSITSAASVCKYVIMN
jgi:hypothetical protein